MTNEVWSVSPARVVVLRVPKTGNLYFKVTNSEELVCPSTPSTDTNLSNGVQHVPKDPTPERSHVHPEDQTTRDGFFTLWDLRDWVSGSSLKYVLGGLPDNSRRFTGRSESDTVD